MTFKGVSRMYNPDGASAPKKHEHDFGGTCHHIIICFPFASAVPCPRLTRKTWRKARQNQTDEQGWPNWVKMQKPVLDLFDTMQPFLDEDEYDAAKAWGIDVPGFNPCIAFFFRTWQATTNP